MHISPPSPSSTATLSTRTTVYIPPTCQLRVDSSSFVQDGAGARPWAQVTVPVQIMAGIVLVPSIILVLYTLASVTCWWKQTARDAQAEALALAKEEDHCQTNGVTGNGGGAGGAAERQDKKLTSGKVGVLERINVLRAAIVYYTGPQSRYFYRVLYVSEVSDIVFQMLAIHVSDGRVLLRPARPHRPFHVIALCGAFQHMHVTLLHRKRNAAVALHTQHTHNTHVLCQFILTLPAYPAARSNSASLGSPSRASGSMQPASSPT